MQGDDEYPKYLKIQPLFDKQKLNKLTTTFGANKTMFKTHSKRLASWSYILYEHNQQQNLKIFNYWNARCVQMLHDLQYFNINVKLIAIMTKFFAKQHQIAMQCKDEFLTKLLTFD